MERPNAKALAIRNTRKTVTLLNTAMPSSTPPLWLNPLGTVKAAMKVTVAMRVATNILLTHSKNLIKNIPSSHQDTNWYFV